MMTTTPNPSEEQIERAARAFFREYHGEDIWPELRDDGELDTRSRALAATRAALTAAGVAPQPVIDEAALAEVIADAPHSGDPNVSCLDPRCKAAAVAAWLREGVAPQEPSRLPDFFAPKPMPNSYVPAPVLPSSAVDEDALAEVIGNLDWGYMVDGPSVSDIARAVAEWLKGQGGESRGE